MQDFIAKPADENPLYVNLADKLKKIDKISETERHDLLAEARDAINSSVYPAFKSIIDYQETLLPNVTANNGAWSLPSGDSYYAWTTEHQTTSTLTPEEIHNLGLSEVDRITKEMDAILVSVGMTGGTVGERITKLGDDPRFSYPDTDEGRKQCLADFRAILDEVTANLGKDFDIKLKQTLDVKPIPAFAEGSTAAAYYQPGSLDNSRPGSFFVNMRKMSDIKKFVNHTLAYHEGIPGHHFQISTAMALQDIPFFRRVSVFAGADLSFTAYVEGWALYAERLGYEMGLEKRSVR